MAPKITEEAAKKNPALAQPFSFTATAEDLEAGFVQALAEVSLVRKGLADQVAAQAAALTSAKKAVTKAAAPSAAVPDTYKVEKGDNPYNIAKKFGISYRELLTLNGIDDPTKLQIGQELKVPKKAN